MTFITDSKHLSRRIQDGLAALMELQDLWLDEDARACTPRSQSGTSVSGGGQADPTHKVAVSESARYQDRDRLGAAIHRAVETLERLVADRQPRQAGGDCSCCQVHTATHGTTEGSVPALCWYCWRYLRKHGVPCDHEVHKLRPEPPRLCECPEECCGGGCADHVSPSRTKLSDRCAQRKSRGLWAKTAV